MSIAQYCQNILNGLTLDSDESFWYEFSENEIDEIYNFLSSHSDNANCLYYLATFYEDCSYLRYYPKYLVPDQKIDELYRQAAALGHKKAKYRLAWTNYDLNVLIDLIRTDYDFPIDSGDKINTFMRDIITKYDEKIRRISELEQQLAEKDQKILELEYRPPSEGGPHYAACKAHFESLVTEVPGKI